jgi:hypothetical protein
MLAPLQISEHQPGDAAEIFLLALQRSSGARTCNRHHFAKVEVRYRHGA